MPGERAPCTGVPKKDKLSKHMPYDADTNKLYSTGRSEWPLKGGLLRGRSMHSVHIARELQLCEARSSRPSAQSFGGALVERPELSSAGHASRQSILPSCCWAFARGRVAPTKTHKLSFSPAHHPPSHQPALTWC
jgi:hypothetical protein